MSYSRWSTVDEIKNAYTRVTKDSSIQKSGIEIMYDEDSLYIDDKEIHNLIIGNTGSGKTQATILPQLRLAIKAGESFIVNDMMGECYKKYAGIAINNGYKVYTINLTGSLTGNNYNPLTIPYKLYKSGNKDAAVQFTENVGKYIVTSSEANANIDPFWDNSAVSLFTGLALYLYENASIEETNISSLYNLVNSIDKIDINSIDKNSLIYTYLSPVLLAPTETKGSILSVFKQNIRLIISKETLTKVLSTTNIDLENIQREKTALFIISDLRAGTRLLPLLIDQMCNYIFLNKDNNKRLNILLDEFDNMGPISEFNNILNMSRSYNIKFNVIIKSFLNMYNIYGEKETEIIRMSFGNLIYLMANDIETLRYVSRLCGRKDESSMLITEEELKVLKPFEAIILANRMYPIRTKLIADFNLPKEEVEAPAIRSLENTDIKIYNL